MKILLLTTDYPDLEGGIALYYIHTRSIYYVSQGIKLDVLNFNAKENYVIDNVNVITLDYYKNHNEKYDLLISHAPNIRLHYNFLKKYGERFEKYLFFFHGHEVLMTNKVYSKPYDYMKPKITLFRDIYDYIKLRIWESFFKKNNDKSYYVFVSKWMKEQFLKWTKIKETAIKNNSFITYNSVGQEFINNEYDYDCSKKYDYITIRGNIDGSKYSVDIVNNLAKQNPKKKFLLVGKGEFFNHYTKAENLIWLETHMNHDTIIKYLNQSKCALMPTRTDAQGLMACEIATFGIPLITSDIDVCHEVFDDFENVGFIDNSLTNVNLEEVYKKIKGKHIKNTKYFLNNTCDKEIQIIEKVIDKQ